MRMLGELLEREVTRDEPEWAAAIASLTVSEKKMKGVQGEKQGEKQDLEDKILSGEFRWMSRAHKSDP